MKDCKGNELNIGDKVVYISGKNSSVALEIGKITNIYKGTHEEYECSVGRQTHILSRRIMKL